MTGKNHYQAYLVRFQRGEKQPHWRATLQNAQTGEIIRFATESQLIHFLLDSLKHEPLEPHKSIGDK